MITRTQSGQQHYILGASTNNMRISVVIVHWNTPDILKRQLAKLRPSSQIEVIVVDNNSDRLPAVKSPYRLVRCSENNGFASGCNRGAAIAKGDWLLFLNPDTHLTTSEIESFVRTVEKQNFDAASPLQTTENYFKPLPTPLTLLIEFSPLRRWIRLSKQKQHTLFGGCLLMKRSAFNSLNGWDEDFFLWFEDSDLTKRLYLNNYRIGWVPLTYTHSGGSSFKHVDNRMKKRWFFSSMNLYAKKHFSIAGQLIVRLLTFTNRAL